MLLYACKECGKWCDASLSEAAISAINAFVAAFNAKEPTPPQGYPCPDGHGSMSPVSQEERLFVWDAEQAGRPAMFWPLGKASYDGRG